MEWLKAIKASIVKSKRLSTMPDSVIDGIWPVAILEVKEALASDANAESDKEKHSGSQLQDQLEKTRR